MEKTEKTSNKSLFFMQGLLFSALGIVLILFPDTLPQVMSIVIAVALFLVAISAIWSYVQGRKKLEKNEWYLILGAVLCLALGIWLLSDPGLLLKIVALTAGIWMLVRSVQLIGTAITAKSFGSGDWLWFILVGLVVAIFAIIFLYYPEPMVKTAIILAGVALLLIGIYDFLLLSKTTKK